MIAHLKIDDYTEEQIAAFPEAIQKLIRKRHRRVLATKLLQEFKKDNRGVALNAATFCDWLERKFGGWCEEEEPEETP